MITDSHAHLYWESLEGELDAVLARARAAGVGRMVVVGTTAATSRRAVALCAGRAGLFPTAGIHPNDTAGATEADVAEVEALCALPECVGVGETGLDFFRDHSPRARQEELFRRQLDLARRLGKPVVVHSRDAHRAVVDALAEFPGVRGVLHCFTLGPAEAEELVALGLHVSFSGVVTYPRNAANREAAAAVPEDRLLVETDCPFLAPQGQRGRRNEPAFVREVLAGVAAARGADAGELALATSRNAARLFGLPPVGSEPGGAGVGAGGSAGGSA